MSRMSAETHAFYAPLLEHPLRTAVLDAAHGEICYLVGGAIRDLWVFGETSADWDLVTDEPALVTKRLAAALERLLIEPATAHRLAEAAADHAAAELDIAVIAARMDADIRQRLAAHDEGRA